jgi:hypothetical protein
LPGDGQHLLGRLAAVQAKLGSIRAERARNVGPRPLQDDDAARFGAVGTEVDRPSGADETDDDQGQSRHSSAVVRESHAPSVRVRRVRGV